MKNNISGVDIAVLTVFKRELITIKMLGNHVSPIVVEYLTKRIKEIESASPRASY